MSEDRPTLLPNAERDKARAALEQLKRNLPFLLEHAAIMAGIRRAAFLAYVAEGFTPEQALELCKVPL